MKSNWNVNLFTGSAGGKGLLDIPSLFFDP